MLRIRHFWGHLQRKQNASECGKPEAVIRDEQQEMGKVTIITWKLLRANFVVAKAPAP